MIGVWGGGGLSLFGGEDKDMQVSITVNVIPLGNMRIRLYIGTDLSGVCAYAGVAHPGCGLRSSSVPRQCRASLQVELAGKAS